MNATENKKWKSWEFCCDVKWSKSLASCMAREWSELRSVEFWTLLLTRASKFSRARILFESLLVSVSKSFQFYIEFIDVPIKSVRYLNNTIVLLFCIQIDQNSINSQSTKHQSFSKQRLKIEIKCEFPSWKLNKKKTELYIYQRAHCPYGYKWKQTLRIHCKTKTLKIIFKCSKIQNTWIRQNPTEFWNKQIATRIAVCAI